jgi:AbrB family looped-hinge helix DNA binding protein
MGKLKKSEIITTDEMRCSCGPKSSCMVESILTIDDRGQMVLPKDIRERAGIKPGDKLALISWEKEGSICCLALMKTENLSGMVKEVLSPILNDTGAE